MRNNKDSRKITNRIRNTTSTLKYFVPQNYDDEKRKFFISDSYNPQFKYPKMPEKFFKRSLKELNEAEVNVNDETTKKIHRDRLMETEYKVRLLLSRGDPEIITVTSEKLYQCKFDSKYVEYAKEFLQTDNTFDETEIRPNRLRSAFRSYLKKYNVKDWRIVISHQKDFNIQVRYKQEKVRISEDINLDYTSLDSLLAHEVDGHILRSINASNQSREIFRNPLPFYIKTEEGLASYLGDFCAKRSDLSKRHHAIKYLGAYLALNNSFREIYNFFIDNGFTSNLAFQRATRIKRGFTDTSLPGCNAREAIYWEGMIDIQRYIAEGGSLEKLYAGKIGLENIEEVPIPDKLIIPDRVCKNTTD